MANPLRYTLVSDGPTDRALLPILDWVLHSIPEVADRGFSGTWADLSGRKPTPGLAGKIDIALQVYPCDLLFVHRDAESSDRAIRDHRLQEIQTAMQSHAVPYVGVVPVRMTEAWLLFDENAIRKAADNPHSTADIQLPSLGRVEQVSDPKTLLHQLLLDASELTGRRRSRLQAELSWRRVRVADFIDDFSPLRNLSSFADLEAQTRSAVERLAKQA
jgi:hypothetical protein